MTGELVIGASHDQGDEQIGAMPAEKQLDGTYTGTLAPKKTPVMPGERGYPKYSAYAAYKVGDQFLRTDAVALTITEGMSVTGPETATVAQLSAGVELQFKGFEPDEALTGEVKYYNIDTNMYETLSSFSARVGADGTGSGTFTVTGATVGDYFSVTAIGAQGSVDYFVSTIADDDGGGTGGATPPVDPGTPAPTAPKKPESVETGVL